MPGASDWYLDFLCWGAGPVCSATDRSGRVVAARSRGDEGEGRVREAYPGSTWERLAAIKGRYDPTNLFRLNQNIAPTTEGRMTN